MINNGGVYHQQVAVMGGSPQHSIIYTLCVLLWHNTLSILGSIYKWLLMWQSLRVLGKYGVRAILDGHLAHAYTNWDY